MIDDPRRFLTIEEGPTLGGYQYRNVALTVPGVYHDDSLAIQLVQCDDQGNPIPFDVIATVTICLGQSYPRHTFAVKNYSENEGIEFWLRQQASPYLHDSGDTEMVYWVRKVGTQYAGFETINIYQANMDTPLWEMLKAGSRVFQNKNLTQNTDENGERGV